MKIISASISILLFNIFWSTTHAVPLMDSKSTLDQDDLQPLITSACSPNGRCWEWLPIQEVQENDAIIPDEIAMSRLHTRRQIPNSDTKSILETWSDNPSPLEKKLEVPAPSRQLGNRMTKKDVFVSRSWGAGGMPFSVLYMTPHAPRSNHAGTTQQLEGGRPIETPPTTVGHPNYRIALRNGATGQPRRQYSIIPQLFISYGWGSLGK